MMPFFFYIPFAYAQSGRSAGLSEANVVLHDESSSFNNIGGAAGVNKATALVSYNNRFGVSSMSTVALGVLVPIKVGVLSVNLNRYGNDLYNENTIGLGFSHKIQTVSIGGKVSYLQYHIDEYGTSGTFVFEFGGVAEVTRNLFFGAHIYNFSEAKISRQAEERLPVRMKVGLGYQPLAKLLLIAEAEKSEFYKAQMKAAIEYQIIRNVFLRTGISTKPVSNSFGFGLVLKSIKVDYALSSFSRIGFNHTLSATYQITK